ncbi:hypothetical protein [Encephalitozoon cuniculi GB-M1]|uniref:UPF0329 protein ECU11_2090 n=1 Tax=Encephalitozoon cuniculi (strain GB-M1) TaxID=284813 RepID=YBK9_ENCCU|nr:uncharacterized protein ECU11_2090 [Encephalitozoon cuniculi GB-M1]Q8STZ1.1 RecName: Full=UPF0329 protein ECU11_2090 [Encephalitozoon cuniculi GB-M1]CAD26119.1 hypothetical protein [Encephalitozoon cuniculi GB-M1]
MMRTWMVYVVGLVGELYGSQVEETREMREMKEALERLFSRRLSDSEIEMVESLENGGNFETRVLVPVIFHKDKVVVSPAARYRDIEKEERVYVEEVIRRLRSLVWHSMVYIYVPKNNDWIMDLICKVSGMSSPQRLDDVALYKDTGGNCGMKFVDLVNKMFKQNADMLKKFGDLLSNGAETRILELPDSLSEDERRREVEMLQRVKEYGKMLCTEDKQKEIVEAQKIMCDACEQIWRREEDRKEFTMEIYSRYLNMKVMRGGVERDVEDPLIDHMDHYMLISTHKKYKCMDVVAELVRKVFVEDKDIEDSDVMSAVCSVRERKRLEEMREMEERKRKEEERAKNEEELLRMVEREEREKREESKGRGKKKRGNRGAGESKEESKGRGKRKRGNKGAGESKEEDRGEEGGVEAEDPLEEMAVGEAWRKKKGSGEKRISEEHHYKVHSRVLRWKKDAGEIKRELDEGYEKKWKNRSIEEIKEQKKVHDIVEVMKLLRDKEKCDRFFVRTGKYMKGKSERWKMVANGILEEGGEKKVGKVEVGLFKGEGGESVVYHLMFRPTETERTGRVGGSSFGKYDDVDEIKKEKSSDMFGFRYPSGVRCEMTSNRNEFRIEYRNRKNTSEVLRTLTILRIPET